MESSDHGITAPSAIYEVGGRRFETASPDFADAIAEAHASHRHPRCMCLVEGVEMYVARLGDGFIVKRMPNTGSHHTPDCPSYEPPAEFSGLGQVLGSAITEDPATGETTLKLDFPMSRIAGRSTLPAADGTSGRGTTDGTKLSLRGLLHYLWDQAELTRWHPGFAGKRTWATVRRHLLHAAENKIARGGALQARLYIPEAFSVEQRNAINSRRLAQWAAAVATPGKSQHLMLLIAELKEIVPARYGFKAVIKHVPDQAFALDKQLFRQLGRRFEVELSLWGVAESLRMVMIATFAVNGAGVPSIGELSLMPVTNQWLPIEDEFENRLVQKLVRDGRRFIKGLRYDLPQDSQVFSAILLDLLESPATLYIASRGCEGPRPYTQAESTERSEIRSSWTWLTSKGTMPPLPYELDAAAVPQRHDYR